MPQSITKTIEQHGRVGPAYIWLAPPLDPITSRVKLALTGNVSEDILQDGIPRPAFGGLYLGYDEGGVTETPVVSFEDVPVVGSTIPGNVRITKEKVTVKANLIFNNDVRVLSIFRTKGLNNSLFSYEFGGLSDVSLWPLLLICPNYLNEQDYVECRYYYRGYFTPAPIVSNRNFNSIDMTYNSIAGLDEDGCLRAAGDRIARGWYVRVEFNGDNILVAPAILDGFGFSACADLELGFSADQESVPYIKTITVNSQPTDGDQIKLVGTTWTFTSGAPTAGEIQSDPDNTITAANIKVALSTQIPADVSNVTVNNNVVTVTGLIDGFDFVLNEPTEFNPNDIQIGIAQNGQPGIASPDVTSNMLPVWNHLGAL